VSLPLKLRNMKYMEIMHCNLAFAFSCFYAYEENRSRIGAVSTNTVTHVEIYQCSCSPHILPSGCVGRSEDMHCIAPFAIHHESLLWSIYFNLLLEVMWCIFYYSDS
jgi:hypothetical protein